MKALKIMVITGALIVSLTAGGIMTAGVSASEPETAPDVTAETAADMIEPETEPETAPAEIIEPGPETATPETAPETVEPDATPAGIIARDTGLTVDQATTIDACGNWAAYYVQADGDLYAITIKAGRVDVVAILN